MLWPKKNSYKEFDNEKKFPRLENSPPPDNFFNGLSLKDGPLENLSVGGGGGAGGGVQKKYSRKRKLNEKKFLHAN